MTDFTAVHDADEEMQWGSPEGLPRMNPLQSQGSLRLRSQASLKGYEASALLRSPSFKVNNPTASVDPVQTNGLRKAIRSRLQDLDANSDGVIETEELVTFIEDVISTENRLKHLKWIAYGLLAFTAIFMAATFGLTYMVADMHKDSSAVAGAWVDRSSGMVLRTAQGGYLELDFTRAPSSIPGAVSDDPESAHSTAHNAAAERAVVPGRTLLQASGPPAGTISRVDAESGCRWLTEGNININLKVIDAYGSKYPGGGATVAEAKGCRDLANAPKSKAAISGTIVYHKTVYTISCKAGAARCSIRYKDPPGDSGKGRRLSAASAGGGGCVPVEVGGVMLPVERGSDGECPACFPAAATALRRDGRRVPVGELAVGDSVQVVEEDGSLGWSQVYLFPHFIQQGGFSFVRLTTAAGSLITLSADHYAYVSPSAEAPFSQRRAVAAGDVARGDLLWAASGGGGAMTVQPVADVTSVVAQGLVNPFTMRGNIVVDGVAASVYNTAMGGEGRMHAFTAAGRALWRRAPSLLRAAHSLHAAQPISLAIGRFFAKNLKPSAAGSSPATHWLAARLAAAPAQLLSTS